MAKPKSKLVMIWEPLILTAVGLFLLLIHPEDILLQYITLTGAGLLLLGGALLVIKHTEKYL